MNNQKGLAPLLIVILIALAVGGYLIYQKQTKSNPIPTPLPQQITQPLSTSDSTNSAQNSISIQVLNEGIRLKNLNSLNYNIEGYILNKNTCLCPKGVSCSPCLPEILVSEDKQDSVENSRKIYIRVDDTEDFQLGERYRFSILLPLDKNKQGFSYERQLIKYGLIK